MTATTLPIALRVCRFEDLPALEHWQPTGRNRTHAWRFAHQEEGASTYLLAVRTTATDGSAAGTLLPAGPDAAAPPPAAAGQAADGPVDPSTLVGSCELRWGGPDHPHIPPVPEINGLQVWPETLRGHGIGTQILTAVAAFARKRGHREIGLGVADPRPQRLYERLGYRDTGLRYVGGYTVYAEDGSARRIDEHCRWLTLRL